MRVGGDQINWKDTRFHASLKPFHKHISNMRSGRCLLIGLSGSVGSVFGTDGVKYFYGFLFTLMITSFISPNSQYPSLHLFLF